jgi:hypothetical protein
LKQVVDKLKNEKGDIFMPLLHFVFSKEIKRFYQTKKLTKGLDKEEENKDDSNIDIESMEDFVQPEFNTIDDILGSK